ncbi:leucine-rich repeat domain-containing protein [bacterium]|nr:leucine-rich repeat domain-containing protein [bacterium]NUN44738.1 leucine-rich repeat domain-containing protein [bacterium]
MKCLCLLFCLFCKLSIAQITVNDPQFRSVLQNKYEVNFDVNNLIINPEAVLLIKHLDVSGQGIFDLSGIEAFTSLDSINCSSNYLTNLDLSSNTSLEYVHCGYNGITSINLTGLTKLKYLWCNSNQISSLDLSDKPLLEELFCFSNGLQNLYVKQNSALRYLYISETPISEIDISSNLMLTHLNCADTPISRLSISNNRSLNTVKCYRTRIDTLVINSNPLLEFLFCSQGQLKSLTLDSALNLRYIECDDNQLSDLDLSQCPNLETININRNQIGLLDLSNNPAVIEARCYGNPLPLIITANLNAAFSIGDGTQVAIKVTDFSNNELPSYKTGAIVLDSIGVSIVVTENKSTKSAFTFKVDSFPNIVGSLPPGTINLISSKYWSVINSDFNGQYNMLFDLSGLPGIESFNGLRVIMRENSQSPWKDVLSNDGVLITYLWTPYIMVSGLKNFGEFAIVNFDITPPSAPVELTASAGDSKVLLSWKTNLENDVLKYRIYTGNGFTSPVQIDSVQQSSFYTITKTIYNLVPGRNYRFYVTSVDSANNASYFSTSVESLPFDSTPPLPPSDLKATSGDGFILLKWNVSREGDFKKYRIYSSTLENLFGQIDSSISSTDTVRNYTKLSKGTQYTFNVSAVDTFGNQSAFSNEATAAFYAIAAKATIVVYQNPVLTKHFDIAVIAESKLAINPIVRMWLTGQNDTSSIVSTPVNNSQNIFRGSGKFSEPGQVNFFVKTLTPSGGDTAQVVTYGVTLVKKGEFKTIKSLNSKSNLIIKTPFFDDNYFLSQNYQKNGEEVVYEYGPTEFKFQKPSEIEILLEPEQLSEKTKLAIFQETPGGWVQIPSQLSKSNDALIANISKLGKFKVGYKENLGSEVPSTFFLRQNYPNPFNPSTFIAYDVPSKSFISIKIYNILGQEITTLVSKIHEPGKYTVSWNGQNALGKFMASGIYIYKLESEGFIQAKKMMYIK